MPGNPRRNNEGIAAMQLNPRYETEVQPGLVKTGLEGQAGQPVNPRISEYQSPL